jgi:hypothetical protein
MLIAIYLTYWQDPVGNYAGSYFTYNSVLWNWGSWGPHVPGWIAANSSKAAETPFYIVPWLAYGMFGGIVLACFVMRKAKERWPQIGTLRIVLVAFITLATVDFVAENLYLHLGLYSFTGVIRSLTIFYGKYYQFPLYESLIWGAAWTGMASVRYFKNDKGQTAVERGIDDVQVGSKGKRLLSLFAICGIMNVAYLVMNFAFMYTVQHASPWGKDIASRSYFTNGYCGPLTHVACPGNVVPLPKRGAAAVGQDGQLYVPPGKHLPVPVTVRTKP